jgi:hypothetical protein
MPKPRRWGWLLTIPFFRHQCWMEWSVANSYSFDIYIHKRECFLSLGRLRVVYTPAIK